MKIYKKMKTAEAKRSVLLLVQVKLKSKIRLQKFENREVDSVFEVELMQLSNIIS